MTLYKIQVEWPFYLFLSAREMTRGKFLNILEKVNSGRR